MLALIDLGDSAGGPAGRHWVLDPIDGTRGFVGLRQYAVCLGMLQDGEVRRAERDTVGRSRRCGLLQSCFPSLSVPRPDGDTDPIPHLALTCVFTIGSDCHIAPEVPHCLSASPTTPCKQAMTASWRCRAAVVCSLSGRWPLLGPSVGVLLCV